MSSENRPGNTESADITVVVRRTIGATADTLFAAWTQPAHLKQWWGPRTVKCVGAEIDLRVGGAYRIANRFSDGTVLWIVGEFEVVDPPNKLVYSWRTGSESRHSERVTVQFEQQGDATEVIVTHERIPNAAASEGHQAGWDECMDGLIEYLKKLRA